MYDKETFIDGLPEAMSRIAKSADIHRQMHKADSQPMSTDYSDWEPELDRIMKNFKKTLLRCKNTSTNPKEIKEPGVFAKGIGYLKLRNNAG